MAIDENFVVGRGRFEFDRPAGPARGRSGRTIGALVGEQTFVGDLLSDNALELGAKLVDQPGAVAERGGVVGSGGILAQQSKIKGAKKLADQQLRQQRVAERAIVAVRGARLVVNALGEHGDVEAKVGVELSGQIGGLGETTREFVHGNGIGGVASEGGAPLGVKVRSESLTKIGKLWLIKKSQYNSIIEINN